jgi:hypothetical protein
MTEPYLIKRLLSKYSKEGGWMYAVACKANLKKVNERYESSWNRCRKEKMYGAALKKMTKERFWMNSFW